MTSNGDANSGGPDQQPQAGDPTGADAPGPAADTSALDVGEVIDTALKAGSEALQLGNVDMAYDIFSKLVVTAPKNADVQNALGVTLAAKGDDRGAEKCFRAASRLVPESGDYHKNLGAVLYNQKRYGRAMKALNKSLERAPRDTEALYKIALVHAAQRKIADYERVLRDIIAIDADNFEANNDLGCHLITQRRFDAAVEHLTRACRAPQATAPIYVNLANAYVLMGARAKAVETYATAVDMAPADADALMGLAVAERNVGDLDSALNHVEAVLAVAGDTAPALNARGTIRRELGQFDDAMADFDRAVAVDGGFSPAQVNRGLLRLLNDDWADGFADLEARWRDPRYGNLPTDSGTLWDGGDVDGASILLFGEQGFGDAVQFIRFAPALVERGADVAVRVRPELKRLFAASFPALRIHGDDEAPGASELCAPLMSLPGLLGVTAPGAVSGAAYLTAPAGDEAARALLGDGDGVTVGLNWAGTRAHTEDFKRSIDPALFDALGGLDGVRFVDLQFDAGESRPAVLDGALRVADQAGDFAASAAVIRSLDLVISVDTATVHLAGALGVPCWALIPAVPDWRWRRDGESTPWYDSVRLFRQGERGDWTGVLAAVAEALAIFRDQAS